MVRQSFGLAFTTPYGRDGRFASLRNFTRNVIVSEFAGADATAAILDALVAYQLQFEFLPNDKLTAEGILEANASAEAQRGAILFRAPMAGMDGRSCASCHLPSSHFTDGQQYSIGTGGAFVTPTLLNANDTAPSFHDGSAADYAAVVDRFDNTFDLEFDGAAKRDLVAYIEAVGHGEEPFEPQDFVFDRREIEIFASTLEASIAERDQAIVDLTVETISRELREAASAGPRRLTARSGRSSRTGSWPCGGSASPPRRAIGLQRRSTWSIGESKWHGRRPWSHKPSRRRSTHRKSEPPIWASSPGSASWPRGTRNSRLSRTIVSG